MKFKITRWFFIAFAATFVLYSAMMVWGMDENIFIDFGFWDRANAYFTFIVLEDILVKLGFSLAFGIAANVLALILRKDKAAT